jgi:MFS family permease
MQPDPGATIDAPPTTTTATATRTAGPVQGILLVAMSCLSVLGAVLLAPVQPRISEAFAGQPGVPALVPLVITVPALVIGLLAPFAGRLIDRLGRLRILPGALVVYAVFGTAPLWLSSLPLIVASRAGVGLAEAAIMTCATTLIADYFDGRRRDRYLGLQVVFTSISAVVFIGLGGALASTDWRTPCWLYAVSLAFAVACPLLLSQPTPAHRSADHAAGTTAPALAPMNWRPLVGPLLVTFAGGIVFYAPIVELSYALDNVGTATGTIGAVSALAAVATAIGALLFGRISTLDPHILLTTAFGLAGVGLAVIGFAGSLVGVAIGGVLASAAGGILLPTLLTWVLAGLDFPQRGRGTGAWTSSLFLGEFVCPLVVLALAAVVGGLSGALLLLGLGAVAVGAAVSYLLRTRRADHHQRS